MNIDDKFYERYYVVQDEGQISNGWPWGWDLFNTEGSPSISMNVQECSIESKSNYSNPLDINLWPDTEDYDQNSPGIIAKINDLDKRAYRSDIEKAFWVNVTRVPICASYLAALAKVRPMTILELGTGGDSAHSTGMFLYWLSEIECEDNFRSIKLVSVDRHPLSHVWPRYREYTFWFFIQGDSITVMKVLIDKTIGLPSWYDMIFIDSSHTYPHTLKEIEQASFMTHAILLDDTTVPEVKQSLEEFLKDHPEWLRIDLAHGVTLIERHPYF
mgnify:CR=1 FL=1